MKNLNKKIRYTTLGGSTQLDIKSFKDFSDILLLDDAHWVLNSVAVTSLRADRRLLQYLDSDHNGRIRTDEVRAAIKFLLEHLCDGKGVDESSDILEFSALSPDNPDTGVIMIAARKILAQLGKNDTGKISITDIESDPTLRENASKRQDGIITTADANCDKCAALIELISRFAGKDGISSEDISNFQTGAAEFIAYNQESIDNAAVLFPFGEKTAEISAAALELKSAVDDYFLNCETLRFLDSDPGRPVKKEICADPMDKEGISGVLQKLSLASPQEDGQLDLAAPLNPLYRDKIIALFARPELAPKLSDGKLSVAEWNHFNSLLAPYRDWYGRKPAQYELLASLESNVLADYAAGNGFDILDAALENNSVQLMLPTGINLLAKLLILQRGMLKFLQNFVSLTELFTPGNVSLLQTGKLVMDGRHFSLITPVLDRAEHKKIVEDSNICIAYIDVNYGTDAAPAVKTMAAAITSGQMQRLFIGKRGIFYAPDGKEYDAKIIDFVEQPVSFSEALKSPFRRFGSMIATQTDKFFTSKTAKLQKEVEANITAGKPAAAANPMGLPMLMMGGGIGIAALGSAAAFIAKTLSSVSIWCIISVIAGIIVIFGGPSVVIAFIKLYRRDLGRFLEAAGNAVNRPMRLSRKLGKLFTWAPPLPGKSICSCRKMKIFLTVIIVMMITAVVFASCRGCGKSDQEKCPAVQEIIPAAETNAKK